MSDRRRRRQLNSSREVLSEGESQQQCNFSLSESESDLDQDYFNLSGFETAEEDDGITESDHENCQDDIAGHVNKAEEEKPITCSEQICSKLQEKKENKKPDSNQEAKDNILTSQAFGNTEVDSPFNIPSKGKFYQHDMRSETNRDRGRFGSRNFNREPSKSKWVHDKYDEKEQAPKSKDELVQEYGYDIRAYRYDRRPQSHNPGSRQRRPDRRNSDFSKQESDQSSRFFERQRSKEPRENHVEQTKVRSSNPTTLGKRTPAQKSAIKSESGSVFSCPTARQEEKCRQAKDETDPILSVIEKWGKDKAHPGPQKETVSFSQRHERRNRSEEEDLISEKTKKLLTVSAPKETTQPRRYSSLRQRSTVSSTNPLLKHLRLPEQWHKNSQEPPSMLAVPNCSTEVNNNVKHEDNSFLNRRNVNDMDLFQVSKNLAASYEKSSSEVAQEVVNSLFSNNAYPLLPPIVPDGRANLSDPQHWIDSAIAYRESLMAQSRAILLSAAFRRQQPVPNQLSVPDFLSHNELKDIGPQIPPTSQPVNHRDIGMPGAAVFPPSVLRNFSPNILPRSDLSEISTVTHSMRMPSIPSNALIGQDMGGALRYPNSLQPVQNSLPVDTAISSRMSRMDAAMPIRQSMQ